MPGRKFVSGEGYRFGFNGKEGNPDIADGNLDFGARNYDGRIGRWWSVDRKQNLYPDKTPYNFSGNSPLLFIDPDGNIIRIHYVENGENKYYDYTPGVKPSTENAFVNQVHEAVSYVMKDDASETFQNLHKSSNILDLKEGVLGDENLNSARPTKIMRKHGTGEIVSVRAEILWAPTLAAKTLNGGAQAPSTILLHEGDHANRMLGIKSLPQLFALQKDAEINSSLGAYDNLEEKRVIDGVEKDYVESKNERVEKESFFSNATYEQQAVRKEHRGSFYQSEDVNSITPVDGTNVNGTSIKSPVWDAGKDNKEVELKGSSNDFNNAKSK